MHYQIQIFFSIPRTVYVCKWYLSSHVQENEDVVGGLNIKIPNLLQH